MKKRISVILLLVSLLATVFAGNRVQRVALFEEFTSTTCGPCASLNPAIESFLSNHEGEIIAIWYHVWWPAAGDPFYTANTASNEARVSYYNVNAVPDSYIDGIMEPSPGNNSSMTSALNTRLAISSPIELSGTVFESTNSYDLSVTINPVDAIPSGNYKLYAVVVENDIAYNAPNGEDFFDHVMRDIYPTDDGLSIDLVEGTPITEDLNLPLNSSWDAQNLEVIIFVQNSSTKEVIQAARANYDFIVAEPITTQMMLYDETLDIDFSDVFTCASGSYEVTLEDGYSSNPDIATATINGSNLSILTGSTSGLVNITLTATSHDDHVISSSIPIIVNNPQAASYSDDFETGAFGSEWDFSGYGDNWTVVSDAKDGYIARSGATNNYLQSAIFLVDEFTETSYVTFKFKTSTEANDLLKFKIDGTVVETWGGINDWTEVMFLIEEAGEHELKWEFSKNNTGASGEDCVWIDDVHFAGLPGVGIDASSNLTGSFELEQNYPNPFNPTTSISFAVANNSKVNLAVYNSNGRLVSTLVDGNVDKGSHSIKFDASLLNSGIYYYTITVNEIKQTRKMVLIK